jgi:transposase, IS5 family
LAGLFAASVARKGNADLEAAFAPQAMLARRVYAQNKHLRRVKGAPEGTDLRVFSPHAPEVECIGKGKPHKPYEFGVKVSIATTLTHSKGGQFVVHAKASPSKPYDGHTLGTIIPEIEELLGFTAQRIVADAAYKGHSAPPIYRFKVYTGQKRGMTEHISHWMRRRAAIEPLIGPTKSEHRMGRNNLASVAGDTVNAVLAAVGYNFRRIPAWLTLLLSAIWIALTAGNRSKSVPIIA